MTSFDKTVLPKKILLSGSDCFHLVLDKHAKNHNAGDNVMRIVFYFNNPLPIEKITGILCQSPVIYWLCNIKLVPGAFFRIPYWKYEDAGRNINVTLHNHPVDEEIPDIILNRDITIDAERFVECDIINYPSGKAVLIISWNHILMDGRGISMLINHLNESDKTHGNQVEKFFPAKEKKTKLISYIRNMYRVKSFIQNSAKAPISSVAGKDAKSVQHFKNRIIFFNKEETQLVARNAYTNGARFGANLFYLSCCAHTVNGINQQNKKEGVTWLPIPYDGRLKGSFGPIISNFVAYLFYRLPQSDFTSVKQTVSSLNKQMSEQLKIKMPQQYSMLLNMFRHFPLGLYYFLINRTGEGSFASFLYSSTGDNFNNLIELFGEPLSKLTIFPSSTFPPGLTFSFLKHADELNINMAYSPDIISNIELDLIEENLKKLLLSNY
jgi:NRPS condensation-like uncharacterized protein